MLLSEYQTQFKKALFKISKKYRGTIDFHQVNEMYYKDVTPEDAAQQYVKDNPHEELL